MKWIDGLGVLLLRRDSIERVAGDPRAWKVGLGFVALATLIRVHDTVDLRERPWHLLLPLVASVAMGLLVYVVARVKCVGRPGFWAGWLQFQSLFWFTAPAAVLYGVPWEWVLEPVDAVVVNLWTLAVVSAWRGLAMVKIIGVLTGRKWVEAAGVAVVTAVPVGLVAMWATPVEPIIMAGMAGVRLSDHDMVMNSAVMIGWLVVGVGVVLFLPGVFEVASAKGKWLSTARGEEGGRGHVGLYWGTGVLCAVMVGMLPMGQVRLQRVTAVEGMYDSGRVKEMVGELSRWKLGDFPTGWEPPPRVKIPPMSPDPIAVYEAALEGESAEWVRAHYLDVMCRQYSFRSIHSQAKSEEEVEATTARLVGLLARTEKGRARAREEGWDLPKPEKAREH